MASRALRPRWGAAAAWAPCPKYSTRQPEMAMMSASVRSAPQGWTIIAASTPSKAPRSPISTLPPPPSSAGVPSTTSRPPASSARAPAASAAPRPAAAMTLCPQPCPMPGRASYSQITATVGPPPEPVRFSKAVSRP